jgi:hypothetical protein
VQRKAVKVVRAVKALNLRLRRAKSKKPPGLSSRGNFCSSKESFFFFLLMKVSLSESVDPLNL